MYTRLEEQAFTNVGRIAQALGAIAETLESMDKKLEYIIARYENINIPNNQKIGKL